jgi:hypothetical protein
VKGTFKFDPYGHHYPGATTAVQRIFSEWASIDWYVPPARTEGDHAIQLFEEHNAIAGRWLPQSFPPRLSLRVIKGSWDDFQRLCERVRSQNSTWDWKYGALKKLSQEHSRRYAWSMENDAREVTTEKPGLAGELCFRFGDIVIWNDVGPRLDYSQIPASPDHINQAGWYLSYTSMDVLDCMVWQIAEPTDELNGNPFLPLLRCYAAGYYPFGLAQSEVVLFAFQ